MSPKVVSNPTSTTVYRIENREGIGPFHANLWQRLWLYGKDIEKAWKSSQLRFPGFKDDFGSLPKEFVSATLSEKELLTWFENFGDILNKEGYTVAAYNTVDFVRGTSGKQIAFDRSKAKFLWRKNITFGSKK